MSDSVIEHLESGEESNRMAEDWVGQNLSELVATTEFAAGQIVVYESR